MYIPKSIFAIRKILLIILLSVLSIDLVIARAPPIAWAGLPGAGSSGSEVISKTIPSLIATLIKYIAVIAVISTMISGLMYLTSAWKEETTKKAKNWIIWSLVWVLLSVSAWFIINLINTVSIPNS